MIGALLLIGSLCFCPNGVGLVSGGEGGEAGSGHGGGAPRPPSISVLAVSPDGTEVLSGAVDGALALWSLETTTLAPREVGRLPGAVTALVWAQDGRAWATDDVGSLAAFRPGEDPRVVARHAPAARALALDPAGERVATVGDDGRLRLWGLDGAELDAVQAHEGPAIAVAFGAEDRLWTAGWDGTLRGWAVRRGRLKRHGRELPAGARELSGLAVSPDGQRALTACWDGELRLWDVSKRRPEGRALPDRPHGEWVSEVRFAPDGSRAVAVAPAESALLLIDGQGRVEVLAQVQAPLAAAFTPDGRQVLVGRFDGSVGRVELPPVEGR